MRSVRGVTATAPNPSFSMCLLFLHSPNTQHPSQISGTKPCWRRRCWSCTVKGAKCFLYRSPTALAIELGPPRRTEACPLGELCLLKTPPRSDLWAVGINSEEEGWLMDLHPRFQTCLPTIAHPNSCTLTAHGCGVPGGARAYRLGGKLAERGSIYAAIVHAG